MSHAKFDTKQETSAGYDPAPPNPPSTDITFDPTWQHPFTSIVAMTVAMDVIYVYGVLVLNNSNLTMKNTCILQ